MEQIKAYQPAENSMCSGQVLQRPYGYEEAKLVVKEMADLMALDLVDKCMVTDQMVLTIGYDRENLTDPVRRASYKGTVVTDDYGRNVAKHAHGAGNLGRYTSYSRLLAEAVLELYERITDRNLLIRRITLNGNHVVPENTAEKKEEYRQLDLFTDYEDLDRVEAGNLFYLHVLDETLAYRADYYRSSRTGRYREPSNFSRGRRITLVTCTPYGINSHRLLVHGFRIPCSPEGQDSGAEEKEEGFWVWCLRWFIASVVILVGAAIVLLRPEK